MDGVLVDSEPLHISIETKMIKELNILLKKRSAKWRIESFAEFDYG